MRKIKLKVKAPDLIAKNKLSQDVYYCGRKLTHVGIEDRSGHVFDVFNILYNNRIYFLVKNERCIAECLELNCIPLGLEVTDQLRDELFNYCCERIIDEL